MNFALQEPLPMRLPPNVSLVQQVIMLYLDSLNAVVVVQGNIQRREHRIASHVVLVVFPMRLRLFVHLVLQVIMPFQV